ncbi:MAG TPA: hypothetical protein VI078_03945 [bacterium]
MRDGGAGAAARRLIERVGGEGRDDEDRRRRAFLVVAIALMIPALVAHGATALLRAEPIRALPPLALALLLAATLGVARRLPRLEPAARVIIPAGLASLAAAIVAGGGGAFLWAYLLPTMVFFVFGRREGAVWSALVGAVTAVLLATGSGASPPSLVLRFLVTYLLVTLFASALEATRDASARALRARQGELEEALRRVRTLTGMLPICCSCRKVRDDRGAWSSLEEYLGQHTHAALTHGICPECTGVLYPGAAEQMKVRTSVGVGGRSPV